MPDKTVNAELCIDLSRPTQEKPSDHPPGLYSQSGTLLLESPPTKAINHFIKADSRITYFHFYQLNYTPTITPGERGNLEYVPTIVTEGTYPSVDKDIEAYGRMNSLGGPGNIFVDCAVDPLTAYLHRKYDGQNIRVRGVACTLSDRPVVIDGQLITNPAQILQLGAERPTDSTGQTGFVPNDGISYRSVQWLIEHPQGLRQKAMRQGEDAEAHTIFPALIIYDGDAFDPKTTILPTDPSVRGNIIREVIIMDYPRTSQEFRNKEIGVSEG